MDRYPRVTRPADKYGEFILVMERQSIGQRRISKGDIALKINRLLIPIVALLIVGGAFLAMGAQSRPTINVPATTLVDSPNANMANDTPPRAVPAAPALAPSAQPGAVTETFDGGALDAWHGVTDANMTWVAKDGRLQQDVPDMPTEQNALFVTKDSSFTDGSVESYFYATSGNPLGMIVRGSNDGYYRVVLFFNVNTNQVSKATIEKVTADKVETLADAPFATWPGYDLETWTLLKTTVVGNKITVSINGKDIMSATDAANTLTQGWVGVWSYADAGTSFDNIRIQH
jgi:hypothetical protein